jgi:hypothetical protein
MTYAKRTAVFLSIALTIYLSVGSFVDGEWFYGLLWGGKALERAYWRDGSLFLLDYYPLYLVLSAVGIFLLALLLYCIRRIVLPFLDKSWVWFCVGSAVAIFSTTVLGHRAYRQSYEQSQSLADLVASYRQSINNANPFPSDQIQGPVVFEYIANDEIEALYSELGPDLVEERRTVSGGETTGGSAGVDVGPAKIEGQIKHNNQSESEQQRVPFTPERKCLDVMNYILHKKTTQVYSDDISWMAGRMHDELSAALDPAAPIRKRSIDALLIQEPVPSTTDELKKQEEKRLAQYRGQMEIELSGLRGLTLIQGPFTIEDRSSTTFVLLRQLAGKPHPLVFKITIPHSSSVSGLSEENSRNLTVFGLVLSPLDSRGQVSIRALAIFR